MWNFNEKESRFTTSESQRGSCCSTCLDSGSNPNEVRFSSVRSYVLNVGKRGYLGTQEVRRVTRVQLVDHGSVNESLMCL